MMWWVAARRSLIVAALALGLPVLLGIVVFGAFDEFAEGAALVIAFTTILYGTAAGLAAAGTIAFTSERNWALALPCSILPAASILFLLQPRLLFWLATLPARFLTPAS